MRRNRPQSFLRILYLALSLLALLGLTVLLGSQKHLGLPQYVQLTLDGIRAGSIYALMALGFVAVYSVTGIINFAQGEFVMLGAMICLTVDNAPLPFPPRSA